MQTDPMTAPEMTPEAQRIECACYETLRANLAAQELRISPDCTALRMTTLKISGRLGFPLKTTDGKKPKRGQATFLFFTHCPFCGQEYSK